MAPLNEKSLGKEDAKRRVYSRTRFVKRGKFSELSYQNSEKFILGFILIDD